LFVYVVIREYGLNSVSQLGDTGGIEFCQLF